MKKLLLILTLGIFIATQTATAQNDPKAKAILEGVSKKVKSLKSMKANFVLNLTGGKVKDTKKGTLSLKGEKYHIVLGSQEIICDNATSWTYNKDTKEVQISAANQGEQSISPAKLLTNAYDKDYKYTYKGEKKEQGKSCDLIELFPKDASKKISKIELYVDKATSMVASVNTFDKNGNQTQYILSNLTQNPNLPDTYFTWNQKEHPGVEVVDLR